MECKENSDLEQKLANQKNSFPLCPVHFYLSIEDKFLRFFNLCFEKEVKMSDFQIFIDSDGKKAKLLYGIYCYWIAHFVLPQKRTV